MNNEKEKQELKDFALVAGIDTFIDMFVYSYLDDSNDKGYARSYNNHYDRLSNIKVVAFHRFQDIKIFMQVISI